MSTIRWARLAVLFVSISLYACASQPGLKGSGRANRFALEVSFPSETGWSAIPSGVELHSGDKFAIRMQVKEPLHLYVQQRGSSGALTSLYPSPDSPGTPVTPTEPVLLPTSGFYTVDAQPGLELLAVVASTKPLTAEQVKTELERSEQAAGTAREPPPESNSRNRGIVILGSLGSSGIGVARFRLVHR